MFVWIFLYIPKVLDYRHPKAILYIHERDLDTISSHITLWHAPRSKFQFSLLHVSKTHDKIKRQKTKERERGRLRASDWGKF